MSDKFYFSPSVLGFFREDTMSVFKAAGKWPEDAVEITEKQRNELISGNAAGSIISTDENGKAILISPPEPNPEELIALDRVKRDALVVKAVSEIAWRQNAVDVNDATDSEVAELNDWKKYHIALMRMDLSSGDWPIAPVR
ncbi:tail fiber assembly protein [Erwinia rhapontici]|uniref:tail fiber assembly protein n=1 Tax=Erwinia rhapontici TaxID=55212 RepID=UPI00216740E3|nr:tail fiber assembly protein [Erwinia rhapontici]MCS3608138.1 hypothetical protein [Erwinia rhapontici]